MLVKSRALFLRSFFVFNFQVNPYIFLLLDYKSFFMCNVYSWTHHPFTPICDHSGPFYLTCTMKGVFCYTPLRHNLIKSCKRHIGDT